MDVGSRAGTFSLVGITEMHVDWSRLKSRQARSCEALGFHFFLKNMEPLKDKRVIYTFNLQFERTLLGQEEFGLGVGLGARRSGEQTLVTWRL